MQRRSFSTTSFNVNSPFPTSSSILSSYSPYSTRFYSPAANFCPQLHTHATRDQQEEFLLPNHCQTNDRVHTFTFDKQLFTSTTLASSSPNQPTTLSSTTTTTIGNQKSQEACSSSSSVLSISCSLSNNSDLSLLNDDTTSQQFLQKFPYTNNVHQQQKTQQQQCGIQQQQQQKSKVSNFEQRDNNFFCCCSSPLSSKFFESLLPTGIAIVLEQEVQLPFTVRLRRSRTLENNNISWWPKNLKLQEAFMLLLLQFFWIVPYLYLANYLERSLLPLRIYCYTDPNLLIVGRPMRHSLETCAAHFFPNIDRDYKINVSKNTTPTMCKLNQNLTIQLQPWRIKLDKLKRVIVIRSAPRSHEYRHFIRSSWKPSMERLNGPLVFVTGQDGNEITEENIKHGDILQLDFHDSYQNLTMKMMGIYRYFTERTDVQQIVVINDDTIVNATALDELFHEIEKEIDTKTSIESTTAGRYLIGKVSRGYPRLVFPWLPWYVSAELYPHKCYPPFVQGSSFVISRKAAAEVLHRICDFPWRNIPLDDILMGIVTNCLGITNLHRDGFDVGHSLDRFTVFHYQFSRYSAQALSELFNGIRHKLNE